MAVTKEVNIIVKEQGLDELNSDIKQAASSFDKLDKEAKQANKSVDDVASNGGAIAILDQLTGGLATRMRDAYEASKLFSFSLKSMRTALIATGIGALVVALGAIVAYWDDIVDFVQGYTKELRKSIDLSNRIISNLNHELSLLDEQEKLLKLQGKSTTHIKEEREKILLALQNETKNNLELLKLDQARIANKALELSFLERIAKLSGIAVAPRITEEEATALDEINKQIQSTELNLKQLETKLFEIRNPEAAGKETTAGKRDIGGALDASGLKGKVKVSEDPIVVQAQARADALNLIDKNRTFQEAQLAKARTEIAEIEAREKQEQDEIKYNSANNLASALMALGEENKAFAVAGIIIEQVAGAAKAIQNNVVANAKAVAAFPLSAGQPWVAINTASTIAGIAAGALSAKKAISQLGGGASTSRLGFSANGGGTSAPAFNVVGTSGVNQLAQSLQQDNQPIQAYVVGNNVTSQQSLDRNIVETATIG